MSVRNGVEKFAFKKNAEKGILPIAGFRAAKTFTQKPVKHQQLQPFTLYNVDKKLDIR